MERCVGSKNNMRRIKEVKDLGKVTYIRMWSNICLCVRVLLCWPGNGVQLIPRLAQVTGFRKVGVGS